MDETPSDGLLDDHFRRHCSLSARRSALASKHRNAWRAMASQAPDAATLPATSARAARQAPRVRACPGAASCALCARARCLSGGVGVYRGQCLGVGRLTRRRSSRIDAPWLVTHLGRLSPRRASPHNGSTRGGDQAGLRSLSHRTRCWAHPPRHVGVNNPLTPWRPGDACSAASAAR